MYRKWPVVVRTRAGTNFCEVVLDICRADEAAKKPCKPVAETADRYLSIEAERKGLPTN